MGREIVVDTNVLVAALRSSRGASYRLLQLVGRDVRFQVHLSVPLVLEYEEVLTDQRAATGLTEADLRDVIDYLCSVGTAHTVFFLWRPFLRDPGDDMVLELAVEAHADTIVTFNVRDFAGAERFGVRIMTPAAFLVEIGEAK